MNNTIYIHVKNIYSTVEEYFCIEEYNFVQLKNIFLTQVWRIYFSVEDYICCWVFQFTVVSPSASSATQLANMPALCGQGLHTRAT